VWNGVAKKLLGGPPVSILLLVHRGRCIVGSLRQSLHRWFRAVEVFELPPALPCPDNPFHCLSIPVAAR